MVTFYELAEKVFELERIGRKIIKLNIGDTNLPTPKPAIDAAIKSIKETKSGYVSGAGINEFRQKIAERENCDIDEVVVGPGSKHLIFALLNILAKKDESVTTPGPYWPAYQLACEQLGLKFHGIETGLEGNWQFDSHKMPDSKITVICNPLNPTSTVYTDQSIKNVIENANKKGNHVILDEAYKELSFTKISRYEGAIRVRSFSKEFNMEGWRLGYAIAPKDIVKKIVKFNQITTTCVAPFVQMAGLSCLENEEEIIRQNRNLWKARLEVAEKALTKNGFKFAKPQSGIYVFATRADITDSGEFALSCLEKGVAVSPGGGFGNYKKFIRICVNQNEDLLNEAIEKMKI